MEADIAIPYWRLVDAAEAVLSGLEELGHEGEPRLPSSLVGTVEEPRAFCDFTWHEIIAAERFLIRCGLLHERPRHTES
jgi:hypothetical protein